VHIVTKQSGRSDKQRPRLRDLSSHPEPYVSTEDLAQYWSVSRRQIYKHIENGSLPAIRMGPRSVRIPTRGAAEFEKRSTFAGPVTPPSASSDRPAREPVDRGAREQWKNGNSGEYGRPDKD
jgi:excisionase family DNA binding protein